MTKGNGDYVKPNVLMLLLLWIWFLPFITTVRITKVIPMHSLCNCCSEMTQVQNYVHMSTRNFSNFENIDGFSHILENIYKHNNAGK